MAKEKILLLVDDDDDDSFLFREVLNEVDSSVKLLNAQNGKEALELLWQQHSVMPDLILLDLNMPKMDGKECLAELKKDDFLSQIPVFIYTTSSSSTDIEYTLQLGAQCFITKPASFRDLQTLLEVIVPNIRNIPAALQHLTKHSEWVLSNAWWEV